MPAANLCVCVWLLCDSQAALQERNGGKLPSLMHLIVPPLCSALQLGSNRLVVLSGCECVGPYEDEAERSLHAQ